MIVSRKFYRDQFGAYICEIEDDGTKHNISVKQKETPNGRIIADEWVDDLGNSYGVGGGKQ